jgi:Protein of unknown function (DUF1761)
MLDFTGLNWLAILVATVVGFLIGGVWYGPLFGQAWLRAIGKKQEDLGGATAPMVLSAFTSAATAIVLAGILNIMGDVGLIDGLVLGLLVGVGFIAAGMASDYAFCGWPRALFFIQAGYRVTYSVAMGLILAAWRG